MIPVIRNLLVTAAMVISAFAVISLLANVLEQRAEIRSPNKAYVPPAKPFTPSRAHP